MEDSKPTEFNIEQELAPGTELFGVFEVISSIGGGGMGMVYKVNHKLLNKQMALKVLNKSVISHLDLVRFQNEARALSKLSHRNVAGVYDFNLADGTPYLAMDFIDGPTLGSILAENRTLALPDFIEIFSQVCDGLAHAHSKGIVHRDLKPNNIILSTDDSGNSQVVIVDFGVAKLKEEADEQNLTKTGAFIGSPFYCSPEQVTGSEVTAASDMYSLGCIMFHALTGEVPFATESLLKTLAMHKDDRPPSHKLDVERIPARIKALILTLLAKAPRDRKWTASELLLELERDDSDAAAVEVSIPPRGEPRESDTTFSAALSMRPTFLLIGLFACAAMTFTGYWFYKSSLNQPYNSTKDTLGDIGLSNVPLKKEDGIATLIEKNAVVSDNVAAFTDMAAQAAPRSEAQQKLESLYETAIERYRKGQFAVAYPLLKECLNLLDPAKPGDSVDRLWVLAALTVSSKALHKEPEFHEYLKEYLGDRTGKARVKRISGIAPNIEFLAANQCMKESIEFGRELLKELRSSGVEDVRSEMAVVLRLGMYYHADHQFEQARQVFTDGLALVDRAGGSNDEDLRQIMLIRRGSAYFELHQVAKARVDLDAAEASVRKSTHAPIPAILYELYFGEYRLERNGTNFAKARELADKVLANATLLKPYNPVLEKSARVFVKEAKLASELKHW